jgi:hypothetical protein
MAQVTTSMMRTAVTPPAIICHLRRKMSHKATIGAKIIKGLGLRMMKARATPAQKGLSRLTNTRNRVKASIKMTVICPFSRVTNVPRKAKTPMAIRANSMTDGLRSPNSITRK